MQVYLLGMLRKYFYAPEIQDRVTYCFYLVCPSVIP